MDWDDVRPKPRPAVVVGEDLKMMSLADLEARVASLETEIARVRAEIQSKRAHEKAASDIFKR